MKKAIIIISIIIVLVVAFIIAVNATKDELAKMLPEAAKPVIYLYPEEKTDVDVALKLDGELTVTYPEYSGGWAVTAMPDGTIYDRATGREYSYLFWEGNTDFETDFSEGFCVPGDKTAEFLQASLASLGLTPKEYNDMIVYWLPRMKDNPYNIISFQGDNYTEAARLKVTPEPDSVLRVFMAWKASDTMVEILPQELVPFERTGFALVEWGGGEVK